MLKYLSLNNSNQINFFFFDLFVSVQKYSLTSQKLYFIEAFDIIFANSLNFTNLIFGILACLGLIIFLLTQANLLNLSFYPNATFDAEKYSPYECGFAPFRTERAQFDIKFYLIALLFLVFDVELMFLLPYCVSYYYLGFYSYIIFLLFFIILIISFLVEWALGMLIWKGEKEILLKNNNRIDLSKKYKYYFYLYKYFLHFDVV